VAKDVAKEDGMDTVNLDLDMTRTAVVLIDLQNSNVRRALAPYDAEQVVANGLRLADAVRGRGGMVVFVRVLVDEILALPADEPMKKPGAPAPPPDAAQLAGAIAVQPGDSVVTKRQWGAFYGTDLDQLLRRRGIQTIVLGGIATNYGVESTARAAFDHGYQLVFAEDAMSAFQADAHHHACEHMFRNMGRVRPTAAIVGG